MLTQIIVIGFAVLIGLACIYGLIFPEKLIKQVDTIWQSKSGMPMAIAVRLILGLHLIAIAPFSKFPIAIKILGYIAIIAAIAIPIIGKERIDKLLKWFEQSGDSIIRVWLLAGLAFAGFLLYAVV